MLDRLRRETRPHHDRLEANPRLQRLHASDLSLGEYATLIRDQAAFYEPLETALAARPEWGTYGFDFQARLKTPLLERDLVYLSSHIAVPTLVGAPDPPAVPDFSAAVGCLYVLEGATLGGQGIARDVHAALGLTPDTGLAFYTAYGDAHGRMWRAFRMVVEDWAAAGAVDPDAVVEGARSTFARLDAWMAPSARRVA